MAETIRTDNSAVIAALEAKVVRLTTERDAARADFASQHAMRLEDLEDQRQFQFRAEAAESTLVGLREKIEALPRMSPLASLFPSMDIFPDGKYVERSAVLALFPAPSSTPEARP